MLCISNPVIAMSSCTPTHKSMPCDTTKQKSANGITPKRHPNPGNAWIQSQVPSHSPCYSLETSTVAMSLRLLDGASRTSCFCSRTCSFDHGRSVACSTNQYSNIFVSIWPNSRFLPQTSLALVLNLINNRQPPLLTPTPLNRLTHPHFLPHLFHPQRSRVRSHA